MLSTEAERVEFADGTAKLKVSCERHGFSGPVKFRVEGLPEGVSVEGEIPEKKNEGELRLKRSGKGEAFIVRVFGESEGKQFAVSTMPALRKLYPLQMFPSSTMDGWIAVNP